MKATVVPGFNSLNYKCVCMNETITICVTLKPADKVTNNPDVHATLGDAGKSSCSYQSIVRQLVLKPFSLFSLANDEQQFAIMKANSRGKQCESLSSITM